MNEKVSKISLALVQSILVVVLTYLLSFVKETEIVSNTMIVLYILHYVVCYMSNYEQEFFKRGHFLEFVQTLKYIAFFALAISISNFF